MVGESCRVGARCPKKPLRGWFAKVWVGGPRGSSSVGWGWATRFEQRSMRQVLIVPAVIDWNRGPLASLARRPLEDRRVEVRSGSVIDILSVSQRSFDGIILDVDNGPEAVLYQPNRFLYSTEGLELVKGALAVDGTLGVWSADRSTAFENTLSDASFKWRRVAVDARGNDGGPEHTIYLARAGLEAGCVVTDRDASMA